VSRMLKFFPDTNVLVSATFWQGSSYKLLLSSKATGFTSHAVLREYRAVLKRDFNLSEEEVDVRLEELLELLIIVSPTERLEVIKEDPDDNQILEGAIEAKTDFIVSYDHHLLDLKEFRNVKIVKPEEILNLL
jgi:uncharacterized protein